MSIKSIDTANNILNKAAVEVGLVSVTDPFNSGEDHFVQMKTLLQTCGEELTLAFPWEFLTEEYQNTTAESDSGDYDLPADFHYMIPQTHWEQSNNLPLAGPLSAQAWTYLNGRSFNNSTIYASFRLREGLFSLYPQPPTVGLDINFEYLRRTWVLDQDNVTHKADIETGTDSPLFDRTLLSRMLKLKFLEAKGFDTTKPQNDFNQMFAFLTGTDQSGPILSVGETGGYPYLNIYRNLPDTGYGL